MSRRMTSSYIQLQVVPQELKSDPDGKMPQKTIKLNQIYDVNCDGPDFQGSLYGRCKQTVKNKEDKSIHGYFRSQNAAQGNLEKN